MGSFANNFAAVFLVSVSLSFGIMPAAQGATFSTLAELRFEKKSIQPDAEFVVEGHNHGDETGLVLVRIDDVRSNRYAHQATLERFVNPGSFSFRIPVSGLKTPSGRLLETGGLKRAHIFVRRGDKHLSIRRFQIVSAPPLGDNVVAYDFGPENSPIEPGFSRATADHSMLTCATCVGQRRQYSDPLLTDGIRGILRIDLPVPAGRYKLTLWTEDTGAWEYIPHPLERRIRINGKDILMERRTADEWIADRYLAGANRRVRPKQTAWQNIGRYRGGKISVPVTAGSNGLRVDLAGDGSGAVYIAGLLLVPADDEHTLPSLERRRAERFNQDWPIIEEPGSSGELLPPPTLDDGTVVVARGTVAAVKIDTHANRAPALHQLQLTGDKSLLTANLYRGRYRFTRPSPAAQALIRSIAVLDPAGEKGFGGDPGVTFVVYRIPRNLPPGRYSGELIAKDGSKLRTLSVYVPEIDLPEASQRVGTYLDIQPTDTWFGLDGYIRARCDMAFLASFGLTAFAPPFPTPYGGRISPYLKTLNRYLGETGTPILDYATFKRLAGVSGAGPAAEIVKKLEQLSAEGHPQRVVWSVADEPSNAGQESDVRTMLSIIRSAAPGALLAGHLNHPRDRALLGLFDIALLNNGFRPNEMDILAAAMRNQEIWLYNLPDPESSAGFFAWRVGAKSYLHWHAQMPTADPFDPTDGREDDAFLVYPTVQPCQTDRSIHPSLLQLAHAATDLRWLAWLDRHAALDQRISSIRTNLRHKTNASWSDNPRNRQAGVATLRRKIGQLIQERN